MVILNETALAEIEERASLAADAAGDPEVARKYSKRASEDDVPALLSALRHSYNTGGGGGDLGMLLRNAVKARVLTEAKTSGIKEDGVRIATLSDDVKIHSLTVASIRDQGCVFVDVRLRIGDEPVV